MLTTISKFGPVRAPLTLAICAILLASAAVASAPADVDPPGACAATSRAGRNACANEATDDYWIDIGNCANLGDASQRPGCRQDARTAQQEALLECGEVFVARQQVCEALGQGPYDPEIAPSQFADPDDIGGAVAVNAYLPLKAGMRYEYLGKRSGERVVVEVTYDTIEIAGVTCRIVHDVVTDLETGEAIEDTDDYFAQDLQGNVWYFGEIARNYEDGLLTDLDGSWRAGLDDAKPGIVMKAAPQVGDVYRQEFLLGDAEDLAEVIKLNGSASSPYTSCAGNCLVTGEFTPLEPGGFEKKYYKPGIGMILALKPETGEREVLVKVSSFPRR
jgi:hypothetical protein